MVQETVYIVDDDQDVRKALKRSITKEGYKVQSYSSAEEFLEKTHPMEAACLVLDVRMPGMSGLDLQKKLLETNKLLPIIFITGHADVPMSVRAMKDGAFEFLEKPYQVDDLLTRIGQAIEHCKNRMATQDGKSMLDERYGTLTGREREVLKLLVAGASNASNKLIAKKLNISHRTVDDHRAKVMQKMQARSFIELVEMAKTCGAYSRD